MARKLGIWRWFAGGKVTPTERVRLQIWALLGTVIVAGCGGAAVTPISSPGSTVGATQKFTPYVRGHDGTSQSIRVGSSTQSSGSGKIEHVIVIVQENRTVDDLFNGFPGADVVSSGQNSQGQTVGLQPEGLTAPYDMKHDHPDYLIDYANGSLNGWDQARSKCFSSPSLCPAPNVRAYAYVPRSEVQPYFDLGEQYTLADRMFQTNEGPSFPAHQYVVSGTSTPSNGSPLRASENPIPKVHATGGCDSAPNEIVRLIDANGNETQTTYPCFDRTTLTDLLDARGLTWRYYQESTGAGLWNALDAIKHIRYSPEYATNVITPAAQVLADVANGYLANVTWITPSPKASDHAGVTDGTGPSWVASVVNAVGESQFWDTTAIFVTWDDWGGWYDHVKPVRYNSYELGFRVPLIVISPYAKKSYVSHRPHEFGSILKFAENVFDLGSLGTTDVRADDLSDCFSFSHKPRSFHPVKSARGADYFLRQIPSDEDPDDD